MKNNVTDNSYECIKYNFLKIVFENFLRKINFTFCVTTEYFENDELDLKF